ncbi:transcriptional regulator BetI [uncultured Jannaschia sp.]|uniref:choline-binding transcriptional repressor BetI n=1 Tax=uncultured Jannaschia sp. TaxID=293347 RepID=UPI00260ABE47|nr:transcriptional regulator BetI [uncultured Jannaschia sp.]
MRTQPEPVRRAALAEAAIAEIGARGSLDVTVATIAKRAGMSPALAHHYFGSKDRMLVAAMRHILRDLGASVRAELAGAKTPKDRLDAIVAACLAPRTFERDIVAAWLTFYVHAQHDAGTRQLLHVYQRRLRSNLIHAARPLTHQPERLAETVGALIDGLYVRHALSDTDPAAAIALVRDTIRKALR